MLSGCGGGSSTPSASQPTPTPSPAPTSTGVNPAAFVCPTSDTVASAARGGVAQAVRRAPRRAQASQASTGLLAVSYDRATAQRSTAAIATREQSLGTTFLREYDFANTGLVTRILSVAPDKVASVTSALRAQAGVRSVGPAGGRRSASSVSAPYYPNDPYFDGFTVDQGASPTDTLHVQPYAENAGTPGQWGMHATKLGYAFRYSQAGNGSTKTNPLALGSSAIKIAIIDTGEDSSHPEISGKIAYQRCFITSPSTNVHSTSGFSTDLDGHGTDVSGIAAATIANGLGFVGSGGNAQIYAYRVFPTPDDTCLTTSTDAQCTASSDDVVAAINDAVAAHVNVINLSLGGGGCTAGVDSQPAEQNAIASALAANIIVVAAAGNDGAQGLQAPACVTGVIAAGASALDDGLPNGAGTLNGSSATPVEYVASYSDWGSPAASTKSATAWGILAPGGDPQNNTDLDELHWIENIWTSTPLDKGFKGNCGSDFGTSSTADCRVEIAGTSMSAPLVAGAAALILAVNPSYQSPTGMKTLLCQTADDIGAPHQGCGRLNIYRAMARAIGDPAEP
jgi:hypothetical protein